MIDQPPSPDRNRAALDTVRTVRCRRAWKLTRISVYLLVLWFLISWAVAHKLTQRRNAIFAEPVPTVEWAQFEGNRLNTQDGIEIGAWYAPGSEESAPSVVLIHGNGGQRGHVLDRAKLVAKSGCAVLLISLRAHGDSTGDYNDIGFGAQRDVIAAVEYLEHRRPSRPIVILGTSLGAAAALFAAEELGHRVAGYILESPYQDLKTAVRNRTENELPPGLDWLAYQGLLMVSPLVLPNLDQISPLNAIDRIPADIPILILAGDEDISARRTEAEALFDRVRNHGELEIFPNAGHLQMFYIDLDRYRSAVLRLLDQARKRDLKRESLGDSAEPSG